MKYLILFIFSVGLYAQTIYTNNADVFIGNKNESTQLQLILSKQWHESFGDSIFKDLSGNDRNATLHGWSSYADMLDSCHYTGANMYNVADSFLAFSSSNSTHYLTVPNNANLYPGSGDLTVNIIFKLDTFDGVNSPDMLSGITNGIFRIRNQYTASTPYIFLYMQDDNDASQVNAGNITNALTTGVVYRLSIILDRSESQCRTYINGELHKTTNIATWDADWDYTGDLYIGRYASSGACFDGGMYYVSIATTALTTQQIKREFELVYNTYATASNVDRLETNWYQTVYSDTIGFPLPDATLGASQEWVFDVKSKDADGSGSTNWWIGEKREPKTVVKTVNCGASFGNDKVYFGDGFALSSDTLWVAFSDTASVDNIVLKKESHHLIRNVNRWITW